VRKVDAWSVLKISVVFYVAVYLMLLVAAVLLWMAATATGLRGNIEKVVADLIASGKFHFVGSELLQAGVIGGAVLVVVGTAANVLLAVLYNLISDLVGGLVIVVEERSGTEPALRSGTEPALRSGTEPALRSGTEPALRSGTEPALRSGTEPALRSGTEPALRSGTEPGPPVSPQPTRLLIPDIERRQAHHPAPASPARPEMPDQPLAGVERASDVNVEGLGL